LCTKETSCPELHNRLKAQIPQQIDEGKTKNKNLSPKFCGKLKSLPSQISNSANYPKLQIQKHQTNRTRRPPNPKQLQRKKAPNPKSRPSNPTIPLPLKKKHKIFRPTHNPILQNIENNGPFLPFPLV